MRVLWGRNTYYIKFRDDHGFKIAGYAVAAQI